MTSKLDDLEKAREALRAWESQFDRYTGIILTGEYRWRQRRIENA